MLLFLIRYEYIFPYEHTQFKNIPDILFEKYMIGTCIKYFQFFQTIVKIRVFQQNILKISDYYLENSPPTIFKKI